MEGRALLSSPRALSPRNKSLTTHPGDIRVIAPTICHLAPLLFEAASETSLLICTQAPPPIPPVRSGGSAVFHTPRVFDPPLGVLLPRHRESAGRPYTDMAVANNPLWSYDTELPCSAYLEVALIAPNNINRGRRDPALGLFSCSPALHNRGALVRGQSQPPLQRIFLYAHGTPAVLTSYQSSSAKRPRARFERLCPFVVHQHTTTLASPRLCPRLLSC